MTATEIMSGGLTLVALAVVVGGLWNRIAAKKGIGWQFIRFIAIGVALPMTALLALNGALTEGAVAVLAGALGFAFGKPGEKE